MRGPKIDNMAITPDTKDWTWVLDEPCPECGYDAEQVPREAISDLVMAGMPVWLEALAQPSAASRSRADRWSVVEYAAHVRDVHVIFAQRVRQLLQETEPTFANWDQDQTALDHNYAGQDAQVLGAELSVAAAQMVDLIDSLTPDQWLRSGQRSNGSRFTVESLLRYYLHDLVHHEWDIAEAGA